MFLAIPIDTMDKVVLLTNVGVLRSVPHTAPVIIPQIFDGRSRCLLNYCDGEKGKSPDAVLSISKVGVVSYAEMGWVCKYGGEVSDVRPCPSKQDPDEPKNRPTKKREPRLNDEYLQYYRIFSPDDEADAKLCIEI